MPEQPPGPGTPFRPVGEIDYAPGAIVSRVLHRGPAGNLSLFAFEAGEEVEEHTTPCDAFVTVLEGTATVIIDGSETNVAEGEMILMPAGLPHSLRAPGRFKMLLLMMRG